MNKSIFFVGNSLRTMFNFRWNVIKNFADSGYKVYIFAPFDVSHINYKNINYFNFSNTQRSSTLYQLFINIFFLRKKIKEFIINEKIYLFSFSSKMNFISSFASLGTPIHFYPFFIGLGSLFISKKYFYIKWILCFILYINKCCKIVVCLNDSDRFVLSKFLRNKSILILNGEGISQSQYKFIVPKQTDELRFILISRPLKEKGVTIFLDAVKIYQEKFGLYANFSIYGFDENSIGKNLPKSFIADCSNYGVILHGLVNDISFHIKSRDILVLPSVREGMSRACMEMAEFGLPVIASNVPGIADIVIDGITGRLISTLDPELFANAMAEYSKLNYSEFNQLRHRIKNSSRRYSSVDEINSFYVGLLNSD